MNTVFHCIHIDEDMYTSAIVIAQSVESVLKILKADINCIEDWSNCDVYPTNLRTTKDEDIVSIMRKEKED